MNTHFKIVLISAFVLLVVACNEPKTVTNQKDTQPTVETIDTIVGKRIITNEIAGANYRKRATRYYLIVNNDTSDFVSIFSESNEEKVTISFFLDKGTKTHAQRMTELKAILPTASTEFDLDSLSSIEIGRLISHGDLTIEITNQYLQRFEVKKPLQDYKTTAEFLKESKLADDFNAIFKPYAVEVVGVSIEKLFFTSSNQIYSISKIETDSSAVPVEVLDCITWVSLKKSI
jgi:hypothetical protein